MSKYKITLKQMGRTDRPKSDHEIDNMVTIGGIKYQREETGDINSIGNPRRLDLIRKAYEMAKSHPQRLITVTA